MESQLTGYRTMAIVKLQLDENKEKDCKMAIYHSLGVDKIKGRIQGGCASGE
jgi:hypothetical protein